MSTGYECYFAEVEPGEWYYVLQNWNCPVGAWDWREYATAYGPFPTEEAAEAHLEENHANPGGWTSAPYDPARKPDEVERKLLAGARRG